MTTLFWHDLTSSGSHLWLIKDPWEWNHSRLPKTVDGCWWPPVSFATFSCRAWESFRWRTPLNGIKFSWNKPALPNYTHGIWGGGGSNHIRYPAVWVVTFEAHVSDWFSFVQSNLPLSPMGLKIFNSNRPHWKQSENKLFPTMFTQNYWGGAITARVCSIHIPFPNRKRSFPQIDRKVQIYLL